MFFPLGNVAGQDQPVVTMVRHVGQGRAVNFLRQVQIADSPQTHGLSIRTLWAESTAKPGLHEQALVAQIAVEIGHLRRVTVI